MSVNFAKNQDEITNAWRKVVDDKDHQNWALYGYEGNTNTIRLMFTGTDGLASLVQEFNCSLIQYAFCRVIDVDNNINKLILINWQGDSSPLSRKGLCASHVGDVANYFKGATQSITIRNDDETTVEYLMAQITKLRPNRVDVCMTKQAASDLESNILSNSDHSTSRQIDLTANVGAQIAKDRKNFWQLQEEEEKSRLLEEKKRAAEKQAQFEKERKLREQSEAKKLAETVKERDRFIEATRNAERRESASSSISSNHSFPSFNNIDNDDDDRVGRRSELIRLERNQETQSLISKGQIKNRRALFERASQQETSQPSTTNTLSRRSSGNMIKQRLDAFQSLDSQTSKKVIPRKVDKIIVQTNHLKLNDDETQPKSNVIVTSAIESVKLTKNDQPPTKSSPAPSSIPVNKQATNGFSSHVAENGQIPKDIVKNLPLEKDLDEEDDTFEYQRELEQSKKAENAILVNRENGSDTLAENQSANDSRLNGDTMNENNNNITVSKSPDELQAYKKIVDAIMANEEEVDKSKPKAVAIYDYQAADKTEISFDPNDLIGFIEKVDVGWWHGVVLSGKYVGQRGLFPHNHVMEI